MKWSVFILGIFIIGITLIYCYRNFFQPLVFRRNYISRTIGLYIPNSLNIIDYSFSNHSSGSFYAKVEIDQYIFDKWREIFEFDLIYEIDDIIQNVKRTFRYESLNLEDVEEVLFRERFSSNSSLFGLRATTRWTVAFIVKDNSGAFYLYVMY